MAANQSKFDYEGMLNAADFYQEKARNIESLIGGIKKRNDQLVEHEWNGDSAVSFKERFDSDYAKKMESIMNELGIIEKTLREMVRSRQEWEREQAGKFRG